MKAFFYLKTCDTCKRIINQLNLTSDIELIDIKVNPLDKKKLKAIRSLSISFEELFNKRAQLYKQRNLNTKILSESDYEKLILEHYTFLKRPILLYGNKLFVGNSKITIEKIKKFLNEK
tara:strand:+ start:11170 stop:11526 length:357 start_codon:yes stop_codon:yes gene_type:complete